MEGKKEYLNEENYKKAINKIKGISLTILLVGLILGSFLIALGVINKNKELERINKEKLADQNKLVEINKEIEQKTEDINKKQDECDSIKLNDEDFFNKNTKCEREVFSMEEELSRLSIKKTELENKFYAKSSFKQSIFFMLGGFIIIASIMISVSIYLTSKGREIHAFAIQQSMPVTKETIEKITPTVSNAAKDISKSIAEGIKEGKKTDK